MRKIAFPLAITLFFLIDVLAICKFKYIGTIPVQFLGVGIALYLLFLLVLPKFSFAADKLFCPVVRKFFVVYLGFFIFMVFLFFVVSVMLRSEVCLIVDTVFDIGVASLSLLFIFVIFVGQKRRGRGVLDCWLLTALGVWLVKYVYFIMTPVPIWLWGWIYGIDFIVYFCWLMIITQIVQQRYTSAIPVTHID